MFIISKVSEFTLGITERERAESRIKLATSCALLEPHNLERASAVNEAVYAALILNRNLPKGEKVRISSVSRDGEKIASSFRRLLNK